MLKEVFQKLCRIIEGFAGAENFKSKQYLEDILSRQQHPDETCPWNNIFFAHYYSTGGFISGEVKLALTLCILGGGSYLDMGLLFVSSFNHTHKIIKYVVNNWLVHESFYPINGVAYCQDDEICRRLLYSFLVLQEESSMAA